MLAVVVDDHDMGVTHVIRGDDHLNNAFRQLAIIRAMGWPEPIYAHVPLIHGPDGAKLSKRHGALGVDAYRDELGMLPEAVFNYLLRLGWGHGDDEIISREQAIEWFDLDHVGKSPSRFDFKKLENLNGHYIREADDQRLADLVAPKLGISDAEEETLLVRAMPELKARAHTSNELADGARFLFAKRPLEIDEAAAALLTPEARALLGAAHAALGALADWDDGLVRGGHPRGRGGQRSEARQTGPAAPRRAHGAHDISREFLMCWRCWGGTKASPASPTRWWSRTNDRQDRDARRLTGRTIDYPVLDGSVGPEVVDIRKLYGETGMFTYDPGFTSTASCESAITYIDGEKGILLHRGYPIDQLAENSTFMEVAYLLLHGELPNEGRARQIHLHDQPPHHAARAADDLLPRLPARRAPDGDHVRRRRRALGLLSRQHRHHRSRAADDRLAPADRQDADDRRDGVQIFDRPAVPLSRRTASPTPAISCRMTFGVPAEPYEVNPVIERAMRRIFILHADHEQNASTSTVRLAGSSGANPFACIAAGIACLWGPAHGGANEAALNMLREIGTTANIPKYIARAKDKDDPFRLMGFGHRVYKNFDPRAKVMKATADEVLKELNISDPVLDVAKELEQIALNDDYFIEKKLYPNVDFYSGVILNAIGFPTDMFTALFALARTVGWVAQWNEMISDPEQKIGRPRQLYTGAAAARLRAGRQALGGRQRQREARARAGRAVERHVAAHRAREPPRDREAEAGPAFLCVARARSARKSAAGRPRRCRGLRRRP